MVTPLKIKIKHIKVLTSIASPKKYTPKSPAIKGCK